MLKNDLSFYDGMYVGVAGNIGVGKSTLSELISSQLGFKLAEESVIDNPYLDDFYADTKRWAFETQIYFVVDRLKKLEEYLSLGNIVLDRTIYEDRYIFAQQMFNAGSFDKRAFETYKKYYDFATKDVPQPDLLIYARAGVKKLKRNIRGRGRENERELYASGNSYIAQLNALYDSWISSYKGPLQVFDFNNLDVKKNEADRIFVIDTIKEKLGIAHP
ncbi:MAG: deoxynucleoside kinase [Nanoarchaeota archaeon]|nr:deoxynucleoside kinase [Nanoarchaeota archaeon]